MMRRAKKSVILDAKKLIATAQYENVYMALKDISTADLVQAVAVVDRVLQEVSSLGELHGFFVGLQDCQERFATMSSGQFSLRALGSAGEWGKVVAKIQQKAFDFAKQAAEISDEDDLKFVEIFNTRSRMRMRTMAAYREIKREKGRGAAVSADSNSDLRH